MVVTIKYYNLIARKTGQGEEVLKVPAGITVHRFLASLGVKYGKAFSEYLLSPDGTLQPHIALFRSSMPGMLQPDDILYDGDVLHLMVKLSGG